jgi:hypothetical protein
MADAKNVENNRSNLMNRAPSVYTLSSLQATLALNTATSRDGNTWYPARPEGLHSVKSRLRLAWEVFTGRADVLRWPDHQ